MKTANQRTAAMVTLCLLATIGHGAPNPDGDTGIRYSVKVHEKALYNSTTIYAKNYGTKYARPGADLYDPYLNQITHARYYAIDQPIRQALLDGIQSVAVDEGLTIITNNAGTSGKLDVAFEPGTQTNTLTFQISGVSAEVHSHVKKSWYAEGWLHGSIDNITIHGVYDYFNGDITVTSYSAPIQVHVDIDLNIPVLGEILDWFIDQYVDDHVGDFPDNLNSLYLGGDEFSSHIGGIKDAVPLNKLIYNGVDYGAWLRNKLSTSSLINDNFSFAVGEAIYHGQRFEVTLGSVTYLRWTTGGTVYCTMGQDAYCEPID